MSGCATVNLDNESARWAWTCPRNHRNWTPTGDTIWCQTCSRQGDDAEYGALRNQRTGDNVLVENVEFVGDDDVERGRGMATDGGPRTTKSEVWLHLYSTTAFYAAVGLGFLDYFGPALAGIVLGSIVQFKALSTDKEVDA